VQPYAWAVAKYLKDAGDECQLAVGHIGRAGTPRVSDWLHEPY
jgi:hypothetical protein